MVYAWSLLMAGWAQCPSSRADAAIKCKEVSTAMEEATVEVEEDEVLVQDMVPAVCPS
jgi:predicted ATP-grasp superfamily ATP-dependent carboligase